MELGPESNSFTLNLETPPKVCKQNDEGKRCQLIHPQVKPLKGYQSILEAGFETLASWKDRTFTWTSKIHRYKQQKQNQ